MCHFREEVPPLGRGDQRTHFCKRKTKGYTIINVESFRLLIELNRSSIGMHLDIAQLNLN